MKFDTKSIFIPHIAGCGVLQKDLELDGALPEDLPDISRLISVDAKVEKTTVKVENGKAEVVSSMLFGILYESDYRSKASYTTVGTDFSQKTDVECGKEFYPDADVKCTFLSCKLLGSRRFVIRARMATSLECDTIEEMRSIDVDSSKVSAFFKTKSLELTSPCRTYTDERHFEGKATAEEAVSSVVYVTAEELPTEYAVSDGRLSVKTPVRVKALCEGESGRYFVTETELKTLTTAEDADIDGSKRFRVNFSALSPTATVESDDYGEQKVLNFSVDGEMEAVCYETVTETAASDAFCADRSTESTAESVVFQSIGEEKTKTFSVEKTFDTEKTDILRIIDTSVIFRLTGKEVSDGNLTAKGVYTANVLAETESGMNETTFDGEFAETIPLDGDAGVCHASVTLVDAASTVYGGENITLRASAVLRLFTTEKQTDTFLTSVTASDSAESAMSEEIRFYYPERSETLWDIAKSYRIDPKRLGEHNKNVFTPDGRLDENAVFVAIE